MGKLASCVLMSLVLLSGCSPSGMEKPMAKPPEVLVTKADVQSIIDFEEFTGRTEPKSMIEIKARVTGYLDKVNFKDGDTVKEGQLLCEIDPRPYQVEVQRAQAALTQAEVKFKQLESDFARAQMLRQTGSIGIEEYEKIRANRSDAAAAIGVATAELAKAKLNLDFTKISVPNLDNGAKTEPPRTGKVSRRMKDPGNLIKADETLITTIVTLDPMYVYFDVDERTVLAMRALIAEKKIKSVNEMTFRFGLASDEGKYPYEGKIDFEDNKLDSSTGTLQLRGTFDNTKGIAPGLFVRLRLFTGSKRQVVLVPERALGTDQGQKFLYVVTKSTDKEGKVVHKAEYRGGGDLHVGALRDGWRVIEKGIAAGEPIIWSGLQRVRKDAEITPKMQDPPSGK